MNEVQSAFEIPFTHLSLKQRCGRADIPPGRDLQLFTGGAMTLCPHLLSGEPKSAYFLWQSPHFVGAPAALFASVLWQARHMPTFLSWIIL